MPVVLRVAGYKFFFYQADLANELPHVHVTKEGNEAKFWLDPVKVAREGKFRKSDLRDIERINRRQPAISLERLERGEKQTCSRLKQKFLHMQIMSPFFRWQSLI
jgi:hypothetical protein